MSMNKKQFDAIAEAINETLWDDESDPATIMRLAGRLAVICKQDNPRFDKDRFFTACTANKKEQRA